MFLFFSFLEQSSCQIWNIHIPVGHYEVFGVEWQGHCQVCQCRTLVGIFPSFRCKRPQTNGSQGHVNLNVVTRVQLIICEPVAGWVGCEGYVMPSLFLSSNAWLVSSLYRWTGDVHSSPLMWIPFTTPSSGGSSSHSRREKRSNLAKGPLVSRFLDNFKSSHQECERLLFLPEYHLVLPSALVLHLWSMAMWQFHFCWPWPLFAAESFDCTSSAGTPSIPPKMVSRAWTMTGRQARWEKLSLRDAKQNLVCYWW